MTFEACKVIVSLPFSPGTLPLVSGSESLFDHSFNQRLVLRTKILFRGIGDAKLSPDLKELPSSHF